MPGRPEQACHGDRAIPKPYALRRKKIIQIGGVILAKSVFDKVLAGKDVLIMSFGAMIGWSWVVNTGEWVNSAGAIGASLAFVIGAIMVLFVGLTYAELTAAMPQCGGELVFSYRALGKNGSYICTWMLLLAYIGVVAFEACALPTVISYIFPGFLQGYLYTIAGFDVYATWVAAGVAGAVLITAINLLGTQASARLQTVFFTLIAATGIALAVVSAVKSSPENLASHAFVGGEGDGTSTFGNILTVAAMTPFLFVGFDVVPQVAEEINIPQEKIGRLMVLSILMGAAFYIMVILATVYAVPYDVIDSSFHSQNGLVVADVMSYLFNSNVMGKLVLIGGLAGIITSWNSFMVGGSRVLYAMAQGHMLPSVFAKLDGKRKTPVNAILLVSGLSILAPFFGRRMLVWLVDAGSFATTVAYFIVSVSFLVLRRKEPKMCRPYRVRRGRAVGLLAVITSGLMALCYLVPLSFSNCSLCSEEWVITGSWIALGVVFYFISRRRHGAQFGTQVMLDLGTDPMTEEMGNGQETI